MDPQDKTRFEIQGKSSVKYHLKANHVVECKRWFWSLNNAIQWTKDEAKEQQRQKKHKEDMLREAKSSKPPHETSKEADAVDGTKFTGKGLIPATSVGVPLTTTSSRVSIQDSTFGVASIAGDDEGSLYGSREPSIAGNDMPHSALKSGNIAITGDLDDDEEYGDDASDREAQPASKDAFNITAHSASLQLSLLSQVSFALRGESQKDQALPISDPVVVQALNTYESAVASLQGLVDDLLKISRDRDAYWQYRLDRETDIRRLWEDSMTKVAMEQEALEGRIEESEIKRKKTKKALKSALESQEGESISETQDKSQTGASYGKLDLGRQAGVPERMKSVGVRVVGKRKPTIADLANLSDSDSDEDEEFFDAVDAGEVEVVDIMPETVPAQPSAVGRELVGLIPLQGLRRKRKVEIEPSFHGYEDPIRQKLKMDADDRPKISLWVNGFYVHPIATY